MVGDGYYYCAASGALGSSKDGSVLSKLREAASFAALCLLSNMFWRKADALKFRPRSSFLLLASDFRALVVARLISFISMSLSTNHAGEALLEFGKLYAIAYNAF